jgi:hypothetical protein
MDLIMLTGGLFSLVVIILFFITVSNIGDLVKISRAIRTGQVGIQSSLDKIVQLLSDDKPISDKDKAKAYDAIEAAKRIKM